MMQTNHPIIENEENHCFSCPSEIKGTCCHFSSLIGGYNIILEDKFCEYYNKEKKECNNYKERYSISNICMSSLKSIGKGGLAIGCHYLKGREHEEPHPKVLLEQVLPYLSHEDLFLYHALNVYPKEAFMKLYQIPRGDLK
jgi:hypothetical protein